ncbi:hypothetical protein H2198_002672 [Neophaeococcomyces mojaviensis]|uniref:Uncharacterized protein n=1 Tax=Neophaeococcomyces mojaviensis TaxID=3383035 RepID=A0ACC3ADC4_9EURO|nr:hypothetical protein H2198_002672 [Knufia sp. JES_112]
MVYLYTAISLMLTASVPFQPVAASASRHHNYLHLEYRNVAVRDDLYTPTTTIRPCAPTDIACVTDAPRSSLLCDKINGTDVAGSTSIWTILCDTDFYAQDIYPFVLVDTFAECLQKCEEYNSRNGDGSCASFVFAPDRVHLDNDCYLKSGSKNAIYPASIHLIGAVLRPHTATSTTILPITATEEPSTPVDSELNVSTSTPVFPTGMSIQGRRPSVVNSTFLGISIDEPAKQYVSHPPAQPVKLSGDALEAGININLITSYNLASDTGTWTSGDVLTHRIAEMTVTPRLSRDGGRGSNINGTNVFIFCDTSTFGESKDPILGYLNGFVSSSVAVDQSMNGLDGKPISLVNTLGQWQDNVGRMRGWVPMTTGEEAFNTAISGQGYRYAVWPNSSPIPLNKTHAIMYAPLVYLEIDMQDQSSPRYTSLGNTLLLITVDSVYGPHANRLQNQFFQENEVNWGSLGGVRAWSPEGQDSLAGSIYVFGQASNGVMIGKVAATDFGSRDKYSYWSGDTWSTEMPPQDSTRDAYMIDQPVMNMDLIYSPAHKTFFMIYLTPEADNSFYYRYLVGKDNSTLHITPPYENDGDEDYVEQLLKNAWSEQKLLFTIPAPARGYAYAGGLHAGYFRDEDITNGGTKILCTWTEHTNVDPNIPNSGYAHKSQVIDLGWTQWPRSV